MTPSKPPKPPPFTKPELILRLVDLPEAELIRRDLERELLPTAKGVTPKRRTTPTIKEVQVEVGKVVHKHGSSTNFTKRVLNKKITRIGRQGRLVLLLLEGADETDAEDVLVFDFSSGGQLRLNKRKDELDPDTAVVLGVGGANQLRFLDTKVGAQMYVVAQEELSQRSSLLERMGLDRMGLDPIRGPVSWQNFQNLCQSTRARHKGLKSFLSDETLVLGVGDIYSDEIMFHAELNFRREVGSLTPTEVRRFCRALTSTLHEAIRCRGTSLYRRPYYNLNGEPGTYGDHLEVYMRAGELSSRGGTVVSTRFSNRMTFYCDKTQKLLEELED